MVHTEGWRNGDIASGFNICVDQVSMKHFVCFNSLADHAALGWLRIRV